MRTFAQIHSHQRPSSAPARTGVTPSAAARPTAAHSFGAIPVVPGGRPAIAPALEVSAPGDPFELEADRVADAVTDGDRLSARLAAPGAAEPGLHAGLRPPGLSSTAAAGGVHRGAGDGPRAVSDGFERRMEQAARSGEGLGEPARGFMESRFGHDFSSVRVHHDAGADALAREVGARAFTVGRDLFFARSQYRPDTPDGQRLVAHELTHVVQHAEGRVARQIRRQESADAAPPEPAGPPQPQGAGPPQPQAPAPAQQQTPGQAQPPDLLRIYSFGPSGAGRMQTRAGTTVFPPAAPVDSQGSELVQAGTAAQPRLFRWGRYFSIDDAAHPYPGPAPACFVRFVTEWIPDDGTAKVKSERSSPATYYGPGQTLGTTLGSECSFPNDRPGTMDLLYVLHTPADWMLMNHGVHFVNDPSAPVGSTVSPGEAPSCQ